MIDPFLSNPLGEQILQLGFVVTDRERAMTEWTSSVGAGPWFTIDNFAGEEPMYCGHPAEARCDIALGYLGDMQIELIQPCDDHPSGYRDAWGKAMIGFHHFGMAATDFDATVQRRLAAGYALKFTARVPGGGRVAYFDTDGVLPGMIELIEAQPAVLAVFAQMKHAREAWTGEPLAIPLPPG